jgi:16S rRNA (cytidine1402-2'-O)-methyltransferase
LSTLNELAEVLGDRKIVIGREMTKIHEEVFRGTIREAVEHFQQPRGEFTLVIEGYKGARKPASASELEQELRRLHQRGITARDAISQLALTTGLSKKELYRAWLELKRSE